MTAVLANVRLRSAQIWASVMCIYLAWSLLRLHAVAVWLTFKVQVSAIWRMKQ